MYSNSVRAQVFEVIVRQAMAGAPWREICAGPMQINNIDPEEVENEVERRLFGYRKFLGKEDQEKLENYIEFWKDICSGKVESLSSNRDEIIGKVYKSLELEPPYIIECESPVKLFFFFAIIRFVQGRPELKIDSFQSPELVAFAKNVIANFDQDGEYEERLLSWMKSLPEELLSGIGKPLSTTFKSYFRDNVIEVFNSIDLASMYGDFFNYLSKGFSYNLRTSFTRLAVLNQIVLNDISTDAIGLIEPFENESILIPEYFRDGRMVDITVSIRGISLDSKLNPLFHSNVNSELRSSPLINGHLLALWAEPELLGLNLFVNEIPPDYQFPEGACDEIANICELFKHSPWYSLFERCCIVGSYGFSVNLDDRLRLHGSEEPAITFSDGYNAWAMNGLIIPRAIARNPDSVTVNSIDNLRNIEVRRMLIERYGADNYLMDSGAELVHEDEYGALYRKEFEDDEPLVMVRVTNSTMEPDGTYKNYFLRVPPDIETAREAVAWTFGMDDGQEYKPDQES